MSIDAAIPGDKIVIKKDAENIVKYKDLIKTEIQCMWNMKAKLIPVITGATGTSQSLIHYLSNIPGKDEIKELQKTAVLDTSHILWKVLMGKFKMFVIGNVITCTVP